MIGGAGKSLLVLGTRGLYGAIGGVETHCRELYPRLAKRGWHIHVIARGSRPQDNNDPRADGVRKSYLHLPLLSVMEPVIHTLLGVLFAGFSRPDIVHIHAIGPSMMSLPARLFGLKVVVTHHGADYERGQWRGFSKWVLRISERVGLTFAHRIIAVTSATQIRLCQQFARADVVYIPNGVSSPRAVSSTDLIESMGLRPGGYVLAVGRFVHDKGFHDLVEAFARLARKDIELVIVGGAMQATAYSRNLECAALRAGVHLPGMLFENDLAELYTHAALFVLPSHHEEHSITLMEAMSYEKNLLVSDIPANRAFGLKRQDYFPVGNVAYLAQSIQQKLAQPNSSDATSRLTGAFDWNRIAERTDQVLIDASSGPDN